MTSMPKYVLASALTTIVVFAACAGTVHAQGSRKDDIVFNAQGRPMAGATVRVCTSAATGQPCTPLAQVYSDAALTQALANPLSSDGLGNYNFYAAPGRYMIEFSGPGITTKQIPNVILPSDPSTPTFTSVTTTSGISAFSLSLTGNLTVNGSTAVAGSLTVGGLPVPTANQDNQWSASQRFKGPIPSRDFTWYMPPGGCSSTDGTATDPNTTGTIASGSATLTIANARDFKNGCGIAVLNAGPTSTMPILNQGCSISSITRSANVVTVTCAAGHNIAISAGDHFYGIQITGVTDASFNGTFDITSAVDATHFTYNQTAANASSGSGTASMNFGYAHGVTGATTYNYKVAAVDGNGGMSAASPTFTVTSGNATLSTQNYNWLSLGVATLTPSAVPHAWVIYSDKGLGGAFSCVGTAYTNGYSDFGLPMPCPPFAPATPPVSATAQVLNTTIVAGAGTTTLTLATPAGNTATAQNVYHDESSFLNQCLIDDITFRVGTSFPTNVGSSGCTIPAGNYYFNGPMASDYYATTNGESINVTGSLFFNVFPWYFTTNNWYVKGFGNSSYTSSFSHASVTAFHVGASLAAAVVYRDANNTEFSGFGIQNVHGHGIWLGQVPVIGAPSSFRFDNDIISEVPGGAGAPLVMDNNTIGVWVNNSAFIASSSAVGLPSIYFTGTNWNGVNSCCMYFNDISTQFRGMKSDLPGGNGSGGGVAGLYFVNWVNEQLLGTEGLIVHDNGPNAAGAYAGVNPLFGVVIHHMNNSDALGGPLVHPLIQELGSSLGVNTFNVDYVAAFGALLGCGPTNPTVCNDRPPMGGFVNGELTGGSWGGDFEVGNTAIRAGLPILSELAYTQYGVQTNPAWAEALPPPNLFTINSTGAGSLAAATYCMAVEGKDAQTPAGLTLPTNTLCQTVGAAASITVQWQQATGNLNEAYSGFRFLFCSTGGGSCVPNTYLDLPLGGNPYAYTFTNTAGGIAQGLATVSSAYLSYLGWHGGCIYCSPPAGVIPYALGIGEPSPAAGVKLAVAGGTIQGEGGIQAGADVAFNASPRGAYNAFLPNLTAAAGPYQRMTLDKAISVTRLQLVLGTAGTGCTTQSTVSVTDGVSSVTLATANGTAVYDSGAVSQNFAAAANLDVKIVTPASGCTTAPQNANITAQYRMQ